jgi:hypothetical protein
MVTIIKHNDVLESNSISIFLPSLSVSILSSLVKVDVHVISSHS